MVRSSAASFASSAAASGKVYVHRSMMAWWVGPSWAGVSLCSVRTER